MTMTTTMTTSSSSSIIVIPIFIVTSQPVSHHRIDFSLYSFARATRRKRHLTCHLLDIRHKTMPVVAGKCVADEFYLRSTSTILTEYTALHGGHGNYPLFSLLAAVSHSSDKRTATSQRCHRTYNERDENVFFSLSFFYRVTRRIELSGPNKIPFSSSRRFFKKNRISSCAVIPL